MREAGKISDERRSKLKERRVMAGSNLFAAFDLGRWLRTVQTRWTSVLCL